MGGEKNSEEDRVKSFKVAEVRRQENRSSAQRESEEESESETETAAAESGSFRPRGLAPIGDPYSRIKGPLFFVRSSRAEPLDIRLPSV